MNKTIDNLNIIHAMKTHILSDNNLNKKFNHFNQKYSLDELLKYTLMIHINGISYRNISTYTNINYLNTIYFTIYIIS